MRRLVIVEDDAECAELLCIQLGTLGFDCRTGLDLRLIAVTGRSEPTDREHAIAAGFDAFLVKPATSASLRAVLR